MMGKPPLGVIFDCDLGHSVDDAIALAVLYALDGKDEAKAAWQTLDDCSALVTKPSQGLLSLSTKIQRKRSDMDRFDVPDLMD